MGAAATKYAARANVDSPDGRGLKSVVTDSLEDALTPEQFWQAYERQMRGGAQYNRGRIGKLTGAKAETTVTDLEDGAFSVIEHVRAGVMGGFSEESRCAKHVPDTANGRWTTYTYDSPSLAEEALEHTTNLLVHHNPFRLEVWVDQNGRRLHGEGLQQHVAEILSKIATRLHRASGEVPVHTHAASPSGNGKKSVVSDPLDKVFSAEELWRGLVRAHRDGLHVPGAKSREVRESAARPGLLSGLLGGQKEDSMNGFTEVITTVDGNQLYRKHDVRADTKTLVVTDYGLQEEMDVPVMTTSLRVFSEPVVLEAWCEPQSVRHSDEDVAEAFQAVINKVVDEKNAAAGTGAPAP